VAGSAGNTIIPLNLVLFTYTVADKSIRTTPFFGVYPLL